MTHRRFFWLLEKIDRAQCESLQRGIAALFRMRAEENDGQRRPFHDQPQHLHPVHAWHFKIEGDDIRLKLFDFLKSEGAVHRRTNDFNRRVPRKNRRDQLPHESGIIDDEDADAFAHAIAPRGAVRLRRERIAGTFRMRTTVPSPRMDAPLTRSLETISPGRALMTSSSSPTRLSTTSPKRFSEAPITMTKFFFLAGCDSMLCSRLK